MADQPISQEIRLPTESAQLGEAIKKIDALIARVGKLEHASESAGKTQREHAKHSESAFGQLGHAMGAVVKREAQLAVGIHSIGIAAGEAHAKVGEFLEFIGAEAALELLKEIGEKVIDIGKEALGAAANAQRMNFAIDHAAGGKEQGEQVRKWVEQNAKFSEFSEEVNESAYLQLKRFGVESQKAGLYMKAAEDLAAMAAPNERQGVYSEALSAFQRMHARGKLDMRSAMRLGLGVDDFASLPQFQGMSKKAISKAVQSGSGNVTENDILNMIVKHTGEEGLGQRAAEASQLLLTRWAKITELPERFYKRLGETGAIDKLSGALGSALEQLDPDSPNGKRMYGALESTFSYVADAVSEINFEHVADVITNDVLPAVKTMVGLFESAVGGAERIYRGLHRVYTMVAGSSEERRKAGNEAAASILGLKSTEVLDNADKRADKYVRVANPFFGGGLAAANQEASAESGQAHGAGYAQGIDSSAGMSEAAATSTGEGSHEALMSAIDAHSPSRKTEEAGGHFGEGFALGIERSAGRIDDAIDSTIRMPTGGATSVAGIGRGVTVHVGGISVSVTGGHSNSDTAGAVIEELKKSLKPMFVDLMDELNAEGVA